MTDAERDGVDPDDGSAADAGDGSVADADDAAGDAESLTLSARLSEGAERFGARWRPAGRALDRGISHSRLAGVGRRVEAAVAHSRIVRWLTREPDHDVVVVDLAETRTVGPILGALDRVVASLSTPGESSRLRRASERVTAAAGRHAVPAASGALLGLVVGTFALTVDGADPMWLAALAIAGVAGLLGLTVDRSQTALRGSSVAAAVTDLLAPPESDDPAAERADDRTR